MARFFRLVKNEYIKVFKKLSTKIMIVLIIICALGLSGIALFAKHNMESNNYSSYDATGDYQQTIDWLKDTNGDPNEIAMWQYLIDNDIDSDDWRYDVLSAIFADGTGDMSGIKKYLDDNDWRGFCQYRLDNEILSEGEKWEYQYRLDKDISFDKSNEKKNDLNRPGTAPHKSAIPEWLQTQKTPLRPWATQSLTDRTAEQSWRII